MGPSNYNMMFSNGTGGYGGGFGGGNQLGSMFGGSDQGGSSGSSGPFGNFSMGGALLGGGIAGLLGGMLGNQESPSDAANPYLNQIPGDVGRQMQPYTQAGQGAIGALQPQYQNLLNNPGGMLNQIGAGFHQSPGFQFALQQALQGAGHGAAAGGMAGSPQAQQQNMQLATQLGNQDYYNWLNQAKGMYGAGLEGEQGLAGLGMQGATNMSNVIANMLQNQAAMAYASQAAQNQGQSQLFGDIGSGIGAFLGA